MNETTKQGQLIIDLPTLEAPPPTINLEPKIEIEIPPPAPRGYVCRVTGRDSAGFIEEFEITPKPT
jgi:hypothetical protein